MHSCSIRTIHNSNLTNILSTLSICSIHNITRENNLQPLHRNSCNLRRRILHILHILHMHSIHSSIHSSIHKVLNCLWPSEIKSPTLSWTIMIRT